MLLVSGVFATFAFVPDVTLFSTVHSNSNATSTFNTTFSNPNLNLNLNLNPDANPNANAIAIAIANADAYADAYGITTAVLATGETVYFGLPPIRLNVYVGLYSLASVVWLHLIFSIVRLFTMQNATCQNGTHVNIVPETIASLLLSIQVPLVLVKLSDVQANWADVLVPAFCAIVVNTVGWCVSCLSL